MRAKVALLGIALAVVGALLLWPSGDTEPTVRASSSTASETTQAPSPTRTATTTPRAGDDIAEETTPPPETDRALVETFVATWLSGRTRDRTEWLAALAPLTLPEVQSFLEATPAESLPEAEVSSIDDAVGITPTSFSSTVRLSDGSSVAVRCLLTADGWRVAEYGPA